MTNPTDGVREIEKALRDCDLDGYITGMDRSKEWVDNLVAHVYKGTFHNPKMGMCNRSMNENHGFSIFRNNVGRKGICKLCIRAVIKEKSLPLSK